MDAQKLFLNGQRLFAEGKYEESIAAFTSSIDSGRCSEVALLSRGVAYLKTNRLQSAIDDFGKVIVSNSSNLRAYFYRGMAFMTGDDFQSAIRDFNRTIELKPDHCAAYFARGAAYARLGNEYEAARNIRTAIMFSEAERWCFKDPYGLFRKQFDKAINIMAESKKSPGMALTEDEIKIVKKWLEEREN